MANASKDENSVSTLIAVLNTDGEGIVRVGVDAATNTLNVEDNTTGSDFGPNKALHDDNFVTTLIGVSSVDGVTPVAVYANAAGELLIDSN